MNVSMFGQAQQIIKDHPVPASVGCVVALGGLATAIYKFTKSSESKEVPLSADEKALIERQNRIKEVFNKLSIEKYWLPIKENEKNNWNSANSPRPVYDEKTGKEIKIVQTMITKANDRRSALPNLIFQGPPGVGKTMIAEDLCRTTNTGFIEIPSGALEKQLQIGNHILAFRDLLKIAENCSMPVYLIMNDSEMLFEQRPDDKLEESENKKTAPWLVEQKRLSETIKKRRIALVNAMLEEFGKANRNSGVILTTNRFGVIDKAFLTRTRVVTIEPPTMEERKQIIIAHLPFIFKFDNNMLSFFNKGRLEDMAIKTGGFTGRNLVKMLEDIYACVQLENGNITQDIVDSSILAMQASVNRNNGPSISHSIRQLGQSLLNKLS